MYINQNRPQVKRAIRVPKRRVVSGQSPASRANVPLIWRVRQYVNNDGASYEPLLADIVTGSTEYHIQAFKGFVVDANHDQYAHKFYTARLVADQAIEMPIQIFWQEQLHVITSTGGVDTTEYTTGTDDNVVSRLSVSLALGINDLHIMTYTAVADQRLEITLDLTSIHSSIMLTGNGDAIPFSITVDQPDTIALTTSTVFPVESIWAPQGITLHKIGIKTPEANSTYSVDFEEWDSPTDGSPTAIATVATAASTEAETTTFTSATVDAGSILRVVKPADDIDELVVWGAFTKNA
jgi:hypothetical protein